MDNTSVKYWLVELAGDGAHDSFTVDGDIDNVKDALKKEDAGEYADDVGNEDHWDMYGVCCLDLEQGYIRITPIRR